MKDCVIEYFSFVLILIIIGFLAHFLISTDHYNRLHPQITAPLPKTIADIQPPPPMQAFHCIDHVLWEFDDASKYTIVYAVSNPDPQSCTAIDVKG